MKRVASIFFNPQNKEIWDWRNLKLIERIRIAIYLIFTGIVEIQWAKTNQTSTSIK